MIRLCFAFLVAATAAAAQPAATIRLGTWNLEFFGNRRDPPRTEEDTSRVAAFLRELRVDVLALQEVGTLQALQELAQQLGSSWQFVLGSTGMWTDGSGGQRVGFLWNRERVELVQAEEWLDLPRAAKDDEGRALPLFHRVPVSAVFRARGGGLDFRAVTVHLKADERRELERRRYDERSTRKRVAEMAALGAKIAALLARGGEDEDVVVLGDFNHAFARECSQESATEAKVPFDLRVTLLAGWPSFTRLPPAPPRPTIRWFAEPIDHIVVSEDLRQEAIAASVAVHGPYAAGEPSVAALDAWRRTYSDHFPLTIDLDATRDGDPAAVFQPVEPAHELRPGGWAAATAGASAAPPAPSEPAPSPTAAIARMLRPGQHVEVRLINQQVFEGTLLSPLEADWVQIDAGSVIAFPARNVLSVRAR